MARVSINKASLDFNISRNTLYKHIKQGKITKDADGKTIWKSPFNDEITGGYDTNNEETYLYLNDFDLTTQKEIYYQHERDFNLTNQEKLVIEMSFAGYNLYNDIDVLVFKEVLNTDSVGYVQIGRAHV